MKEHDYTSILVILEMYKVMLELDRIALADHAKRIANLEKIIYSSPVPTPSNN